MGMYEVTRAKVFKKVLKIKDCIKNALCLVCKILKIRKIYKEPVSIVKLMPEDYFASSESFWSVSILFCAGLLLLERIFRIWPFAGLVCKL